MKIKVFTFLLASLFLLSQQASAADEPGRLFWTSRLTQTANWFDSQNFPQSKHDYFSPLFVAFHNSRVDEGSAGLDSLASLRDEFPADFRKRSEEVNLTQLGLTKEALERIDKNLVQLKEHLDYPTQLVLSLDTLMSLSFLERVFAAQSDPILLKSWVDITTPGNRTPVNGRMLLNGQELGKIHEIASRLGTRVGELRATENVRGLVSAIFFRELLESMIVLFALLVGLGVAERKELFKGAALGLSLGIVLFSVILSTADFFADKGLLRYFVLFNAVFSISILLFATNWNFHKFYWSKWISSLKKMSHTKKSRILLGVGFFAVFRESAELSVSMSLFNLEAGMRPVIEGLLIVLPVVALFGFLLYRGLAKASVRPLLIVSGAAMTLVTIVFAGFSVKLLQVFGWINSTPLPFEVPHFLKFWFSLHPTYEGFTAMGLCALIVLVPLLRHRIRLPAMVSGESSRSGFGVIPVIVGAAIASMALYGSMALFRSFDKGTQSTRIFSTVGSLEDSIRAAVKDPENYPPSVENDLINFTGDYGAGDPRLSTFVLTDLDIDGNRVTVADSGAALYFDANGTFCSRGDADFPDSCPIRVELDVLRSLKGASYPTFNAAYRIQVDAGTQAMADRGYTGVRFRDPAPDAALAASYPFSLPSKEYASAVTSSDCNPWGAIGTDASGDLLCLTPPSACPAESFLRGIQRDPLNPQDLQAVCEPYPHFSCPENYALTKMGINDVDLQGACKFITPAIVPVNFLADQAQLKIINCPRQHYAIDESLVTCTPGGGAAASNLSMVKAKVDDSDQHDNMVTCSLINGLNPIPAAWTIAVSVGASVDGDGNSLGPQTACILQTDEFVDAIDEGASP